MSFVVAIDGPAGSGKGTVTKELAEKYGLVNIDTGAMYRCVALQSIRENVTLNETDKIIEISNNVKIDLKEDGKVYLNGEDVSKEIRSKEVSQIVSPLSSIVGVRLNMVKLQRELAEGKRVIMEGRDITTYVFPNANVKIYLDASVDERAKRRYKEMQEKGIQMTYEEVLENIKKRDENDRHKEIGSLQIAPDATVVDTTDLCVEEVVEKISEIIKDRSQKSEVRGRNVTSNFQTPNTKRR